MIPTPVTVHLILLATLTLFMVTFMAGNGFCLSPLVPGVDGYDENGYDVDIPGEDYGPNKPKVYLQDSIPGLEGEMAEKVLMNRDWIESVMNDNKSPSEEDDDDDEDL